MRRALLLDAAALLASLLIALGAPLAAGDPFRGTLVLVPLVAAALHHVGLRARRAGAPGLPRGVVAAELAALAGLFVATLGRRSFGLAPDLLVADRLLAAAWLLLLAHRLARLLPALRATLGEALPERPPWPFFALPLIVYLAILPWSAAHHPPDGDEPYYLLITHSLAWDFDSELTDNYARRDSLAFLERELEPQPGDPVGRGGEIYSRHNTLLPLLLAPAYRLAGRWGALVVMAMLAAALAWTTLRVARFYVPSLPGAALAAWAILAFTAPLVIYSYQVWIEVPAALLVVLALEALHRLRHDPAPGARPLLLLALPLALLPLLKIRLIVVSGGLLLLALLRSGRAARRGLVAIGFLLGLLAAAVPLYNQAAFGNPLKYHSIGALGAYARWSPLRYVAGLAGLLFDCAFGLFAYAPLWMLLLPAALVALARRHRLVLDFAVVFLPYLLLLGPRGEWYGGWSPPFRYGMVLLPMLALALAPLLADRRRPGARALVVALAALTLALTLLWVVQPAWTYNHAHGRSHLLDYLSSRTASDTGRLFPSSVRPRAATWIWPPAALLLLAAAWWLPGRRRGGAAAGLVGLLLAPGLLVWSAGALPTRVVEFEDTWVRKSSGGLFPERWVTNRPRYRGGWSIPAGESLTVPLVPGGERLRLSVDYLRPLRSNRPVDLVVRAGDRPLDRKRLRRRAEWRSIDFDPLPWRPDEPLVLALESPAGTPRGTWIVLDRARLEWSD